MIASLRAWFLALWHRASAPVEHSREDEEWERHYWQAW